MTPKARLALVALAACAAGKPHTQRVVAQAPPPPLVIRKDPGLVDMTADPTTTLVLASTRSELGVRFRITGKAPPDARRPQLNLGLVVDTSGSMEGDSIEAVRASAKQLIGKLRDGDRVSLVTFDSTAHVVVPNVEIGPANRARILASIDQLVPRGTTALYEGLSSGLTLVARSRLPNGINRIVLLSDGVPNSSANLPALVSQLHSYGISVTTLGMGIDYDTRLMTQLARDTGGSFTYIEKPDQVSKVFDDELAKMTTIVGRNLQLAIQPGPGVTILPGPGLSAAGDGKFYTTIGDLPADESRDIMVPIAVTARGDKSAVELVEGTLSFDDMIGSSGRQTRSAYVGIKASSDAAQVHAAVNPALEVMRVRAAAAAAILEAMDLARAGNVTAARKRIADAIADVRAAFAASHDATLQPVLDQLAQVSKQLAQIVVPAPNVIAQPKTSSVAPTPQPAVAPTTVEPKLRKAEQDAQDTIMGVSPRER